VSGRHTPTIVVAPDKFRGSLSSSEAADAVGAGVRDALPEARVLTIPVADGGEGTLDVLGTHGMTRVPIRVAGPVGGDVDSEFGR
jgi:glycerate kinase